MSILSIGAGASEGLQDYLMQMLRESQMEDQRRRTAEEIRRNKAVEAQTVQQAQAQAEAQQLLRQTQAQTRADTQANTMRDDIRTSLGQLPNGAMVSPETRDTAVSKGAAFPELFSRFDVPKIAESDFISPEAQAASQDDPVAYFLQRAETTQARQPANLQRETMLVDGKPQDVLVDPSPDAKVRVRSLTGEDVTSRAAHYEKAPAPDRVIVTTSAGPMSREEFLRRTKAGEDLTIEKEVTNSTKTMMEGAQMLLPHVPELASLAEQLQKRGLFGPVMGRIRELAQKFGTTGSPDEVAKNAQALADTLASDPALNQDRLVGQFATSLGLMTSGMGRVHGGARGGGSIQMITYLKSLLSGTSSLNMFLGRLDSIESYLGTYAKGPKGTATPAGGGGDLEKQLGDLFDQFMQSQTPR